MSSARDDVLRRVRSALLDVPDVEEAGGVAVERSYRRGGEGDRRALSARFADRVAEYKATVRRVAAPDLATALGEACRERGARRLGVPADLPAEWRPEGVELVVDGGLGSDELDALDGALTGCALGIAETGTIVLDGGARQGRRALTLVPDLHLCVVDEEQVVGLVPEAIERLGPAVRAGRPLTFISGPSATSDIELSRVEGVHGPRTLDVVIAGR
jgi:L-lactate dehydrogenase complex protein LldG